MEAKGPVWWKLVLGFLLVSVETKQILFPGTRALQPSNGTQAASMLFVECSLMLLGLWLIFSGIRAGQKL